MAKLTLLQMTQDILNDLDDDEVNSVNDTLESLQVVQILQTTFFELIANRNWPHLKQLITLDSVSDTTKPTHLKLPVLVKELEFVNYNIRDVDDNRDRYERIEYLHPDDFLFRTNNYNTSQTNVDSITDFSGVTIQIKNDREPEWWTSFDDEHIVFNAYDKVVDTTLQASKTQCRAVVEPAWTVSDTFIPDLPSEAFPLLLAEAKSTAFNTLKQQPNAKEEQKSTRQKRWLARKAWKARGGVRLPDYGRKTRFSRRSPHIDKEGK